MVESYLYCMTGDSIPGGKKWEQACRRWLTPTLSSNAVVKREMIMLSCCTGTGMGKFMRVAMISVRISSSSVSSPGRNGGPRDTVEWPVMVPLMPISEGKLSVAKYSMWVLV